MVRGRTNASVRSSAPGTITDHELARKATARERRINLLERLYFACWALAALSASQYDLMVVGTLTTFFGSRRDLGNWLPSVPAARIRQSGAACGLVLRRVAWASGLR